ncbi:MAG: hypothetical protein AAFY82_10835, partial [Pseudomonadota bacterium]
MVRLSVIITLVMAAIIAPAIAEPRPMSPVDFLETPRLSEPALSPDGRYLAYLRSETVWRENKIIEHLDLIEVATGAALPSPDFGDADPGEEPARVSKVWWHPDSRRFVYLKRAAASDKPQAFLFDLNDQESRQLTAHGESVLDVIWRPDGSGFYFITAEQQPTGDTQLLSSGWIIPPFESNADREVWSFDLDTGETAPVISGRFSVRQVSLSRDGQRLIFSRVPDHKL